MKYRQLGGEERSVLAALRLVGLKPAEIARELGRHRSTVSRELKRNAAPYDGRYRARPAQERAHGRVGENVEVIHLVTTARGPVEAASSDEIARGIRVGHAAIGRTFAAIVSPEALGRWRGESDDPA